MKKTILTALPVILGLSQAQAVPTMYPDHPTVLHRILNETTSNIIGDNKDPKVVYVMPPNTGEATVNGLHTISANVGFCGEMKDLQLYSRETVKRINDLAIEELQAKRELQKLVDAVREAQMDAAQFVADKKLQALADMDARISEMEDRLSTLYKDSETCKNSCDVIHDEMSNLEKEKHKLVKERRELAKQNVVDSKIYDKKKEKVRVLKESIETAKNDYIDRSQRLITIRENYLGMYSRFAKMEGGRAAFRFESGWEANRRTLAASNPGYQFELIPTQKSLVYASIKGAKDIPGDLAILAYEFGGVQKENHVELEGGFRQNLSSNIVLSLLGTCPMLHPQDFGLPKDYSVNDMKYGMTQVYEFPSSTKLRLTASYNMYKMYEKVVSSGSSGGFFSSRSWTKVEERNFFKDSYKAKWEQTDPQNQISDQERAHIESEMRKHLFERLGLFALPSSPDRNGIIAAAAPPPHGAVVIAESLVKACPGNIYCVAGSLALTALDSIFGSSKATASYKQTHDVWLEEVWELDKTIMKPWVTSFVPPKNQ